MAATAGRLPGGHLLWKRRRSGAGNVGGTDRYILASGEHCGAFHFSGCADDKGAVHVNDGYDDEYHFLNHYDVHVNHHYHYHEPPPDRSEHPRIHPGGSWRHRVRRLRRRAGDHRAFIDGG